MKKMLIIFVIALCALPIFAFDGVVKCKITGINVTGGNDYAFQVKTDETDLLNTTHTPHNDMPWAYLNVSDSNYKTYVAILSLAYSMGHTVELSVFEKAINPEKKIYYAHIGVIKVYK